MRIKEAIKESIALKEKILKDKVLLQTVSDVAEACVDTLCADGKVLFCGNGGSAADAQHLAAELSGRFYYDRDPLFAEALHVNTSYLTAVANDYSYDEIFSRLVKAKGRKGDVLIGLSTSGNSGNILRAFDEAEKIGMINVAFTGETGGKMKKMVDFLINVPSKDTPRIQEAHITIGHIICELIESKLFPKE
ncbi:MAG: D-sedoheptulose 7-phosphate isomerase [Bacteroidales bacterium]|nr:D-sedoheptulose 7-phosphate isomerase [Bacteroidales bacterium]MCF8343433.1 D-sedoheptulose 7-phosphate isomerase [Bacteroidales bacterium]MCF8349888.1 D-sedoheptulose 7-phosphate isomerase [Bacteroidales bacterium]MCF8376769.1 D-sedoheptulose 7-phosphate isomerase [Bacteroidales bacterium]